MGTVDSRPLASDALTNSPARHNPNWSPPWLTAGVYSTGGVYMLLSLHQNADYAGALNLFGGILIQKRRAEKALEASGLNYTIVRPGGMEKPTDEYKKTNNVRLSTANKLFGGQVSRLQVAELITSALANPELASSKVCPPPPPLPLPCASPPLRSNMMHSVSIGPQVQRC